MDMKIYSEEEAEIMMASILAKEDFCDAKNVTLKQVHDVFRKWYNLRDTNRIDVVLAAALSRKMEGTPLWLIVVSPSGDMKSEQINALDDDGVTAKLIHKFSDKTLVNGFKDKIEHPDLAPKLNDKIMLIPDMAEILQLHPNIKNQVWAQLRNLYDGFAGVQTGMGTDVEYRGLRVTLIAGSTPAIDEQILIHQSLGTREFFYRPKEVVSIENTMRKVWFNEKFESVMHGEIKAACQNFLRTREPAYFEISEEIQNNIMSLALYLTLMRAAAPIDSYTGDLRGMVHPEKPTRVLKQLKRLFICLKNLDTDYSDEKALTIVKEVVDSSVDVIRQKILDILIEQGTLSTSAIADRIKVGKKTAKSDLAIMWHLDLLHRDIEEATNSQGYSYVLQELWSVNEENPIIKAIRHQITYNHIVLRAVHYTSFSDGGYSTAYNWLLLQLKPLISYSLFQLENEFKITFGESVESQDMFWDIIKQLRREKKIKNSGLDKISLGQESDDESEDGDI